MAISQTQCSSFKQELYQAIHAFGTDTFKIALYTSAASLDSTTTVYTTTGEVPDGGGYLAGGIALTGVTVSLTGTTAYVDFSDPSWGIATFTARGALIYNYSKANRAVAVLDFGSDKVSVNQTFAIRMPLNDASNAIIRNA
jgi:hypothetical protein